MHVLHFLARARVFLFNYGIIFKNGRRMRNKCETKQSCF